jgi:hypothetical protein
MNYVKKRKRKRKENPHLPTKFESHGFPKVAEPSSSSSMFGLIIGF